jgi:hypothetical protein
MGRHPAKDPGEDEAPGAGAPWPGTQMVEEGLEAKLDKMETDEQVDSLLADLKQKRSRAGST